MSSSNPKKLLKKMWGKWYFILAQSSARLSYTFFLSRFRFFLFLPLPLLLSFSLTKFTSNPFGVGNDWSPQKLSNYGLGFSRIPLFSSAQWKAQISQRLSNVTFIQSRSCCIIHFIDKIATTFLFLTHCHELFFLVREFYIKLWKKQQLPT